jgi:hypothetical protein
VQFLGISKAGPELENVRPVDDGGGKGIRTFGTLLTQAAVHFITNIVSASGQNSCIIGRY